MTVAPMSPEDLNRLEVDHAIGCDPCRDYVTTGSSVESINLFIRKHAAHPLILLRLGGAKKVEAVGALIGVAR